MSTTPDSPSPADDPDATLRAPRPGALDPDVTLRALSVGRKVFGRYTLQRVLGRGGMGVVWLARDGSLETDVALKFLPEVVVLDEGALRDLKKEALRSRELTHAHIVRIHDFVEGEGCAAIAMEYIDGATLAKRRFDQPGEVFAPETLLPWVKQLAEALDYAHGRARVVHRDLKPANLMVNSRGELKITDFGIAATLTDTATRLSRTLVGSSGSPPYMSPQQMLGEQPAVTDDVYALGATLYELLTGKPPFYTGNIMLQVQTQMPSTMSARRVVLHGEAAALKLPALPPAWEQTIAACLAKDPTERPQSMGEVYQRLTSEAPVAAPPPESRAAGTRSKRRKEQPKGQVKELSTEPPEPSEAPKKRAKAPAQEPPSKDRPKELAREPQQRTESRESTELRERTEPPESPESARGRPWRWVAMGLLAAAFAFGAWLLLRPPPVASDLPATSELSGPPAAPVAGPTSAPGSELVSTAPRVGSSRQIYESLLTATPGAGASAPDGPAGGAQVAFPRVKAALVARPFVVTVDPDLPDTRLRLGPQEDVEVLAGRAELRGLPPGEHELAVQAPGYQPFVTQVTVAANGGGEASARLVPIRGGVEVSARAGTVITARDAGGREQRLGEVPASGTLLVENVLDTGNYTFRADHAECAPAEVAGEVRAGGNLTLRLEQTVLPGKVRITTTPPGAVVRFTGGFLNDVVWKALGGGERVTPFDGALMPGDYTLRFILAGYQPAERTVTVAANREQSLAVVLEEIRQPRAGQPFENTLGMKFVPVPGAAVLFSIWATRVADFEVFVRETGYDATGGAFTYNAQGQWGQHGATWKAPGFAQDGRHPVTCVSAEDAEAFCAWLTKKERAAGKLGADQSYRLPTDAEWDVAAGPGEFPWGGTWPPPKGAGNYADASAKRQWPTWTVLEGYDDGYAFTSPVGAFSANAHGLYDMGGNVWQRVSGRVHGTRGASFAYYSRNFLASAYHDIGEGRFNNYGFRCVLVVEPAR